MQTALAAPPSEKAVERLLAAVNPEHIRERQIRGGGTSEYIPHLVYSRILSETLGFRWSWEILNEELIEAPQYSKGKKTGETIHYVKITGRLTIHGLGSWTEIGVVRLEDEESWKKATTAAFRKACDRAGIAIHTWNNRQLHEDDLDDDVADDEPRTEPRREEPSRNEPRRDTPRMRYTDEQIAKMKDIKAAYRIQDNVQLMKLVRAWNPNAQSIPTPDEIDEFIRWVHQNPDECEAVLGAD